MSRHPSLCHILAAVVLLAGSRASAQSAPEPPPRSATKQLPRLAVATAVQESGGQDRENVEDLLMIELENQPFLQLVDRQALQAVMKEHAIALTNQADTKDAIALGKFARADYLLYVLVVNDKILATERKALLRLVEVATGQVKVDEQIALSENLALSMAAVREKFLTAVRPDARAASRLTVGIAQFPNRSGTGRSDKLGVELQEALRNRLRQEAWAAVLEREYPKVLLDELDLGRAGLVRDGAVETLPPADLVISGSTDDVSRVYEPGKPWKVALDLSLWLRGHVSHVSQTFASDAIEAAADDIMQKIEQFGRQPAPQTTVPEKELWRREGLYLMPKPRPHAGPGLNPNYAPTSELNQRELIRAWENVLLLDGNDPEALMYLGACLIGFDQYNAQRDPRKVAQWIAGSRLVERALAIRPTRDCAATYSNCIQQFLFWSVAPQRAKEMAQYVVDHPRQFQAIGHLSHIKVALTKPAWATRHRNFDNLQFALSNAESDPNAVLILFQPRLTRDAPFEPYSSFLAPYLDSPDPVVQFAVQRAMGVLLCWVKKDSAGLEHFDKAIAVVEAAYQRCSDPYRESLDNIYRVRIEACQYLGLPEEAKKTAWAGARHFMKLGRFGLDRHAYAAVGWLYEFCVTKALEAGPEREALEICNAYVAGAKEDWERFDGWPQICAKREELSARLARKAPPGLGGLRLVVPVESLLKPGRLETGIESMLGPGQPELVAMRMTAAAGKLWFVPLSRYDDNSRMMYDPRRNEVTKLSDKRSLNVAATTDAVFFGGHFGLDAFDTSGKFLKHYDGKSNSFPGNQIFGLCAGGGRIYFAFRGPPLAGIAVLDPATGAISILAPSSRDAKREQEPTERMSRLQWDAVTPRLYAVGFEHQHNRLLALSELYGWSPQDKTWQRYPVEQAPQLVVSDGNETLVVRIMGQQSEFHFVKADQTVTALVPLPRLMGEPAWDRQRIWVPTASGLYEVDRTTAAVKWLAYQDGNQFLSVLKTDDRLYVAASGGLYCYGDPASTGPASASLIDPTAKAAPSPGEAAAAKSRSQKGRRRAARQAAGNGFATGSKPAVGEGPQQAAWFSAGPGWKELNIVASSQGIYLFAFSHCAAHYQSMLSKSQPGSTIVLLFALNKPDTDVLPAEYADLLPMPWAQIEAALKRGETVESAGQSRQRKIVLLAAPTELQLKALIHRTKLLAANPPNK